MSVPPITRRPGGRCLILNLGAECSHSQKSRARNSGPRKASCCSSGCWRTSLTSSTNPPEAGGRTLLLIESLLRIGLHNHQGHDRTPSPVLPHAIDRLSSV